MTLSGPQWTALARESFPHLRDRVYLDTASAGLSWHGQGHAVARFYDDIKSRGYDARPEWWALVERVRERCARWLGVNAEDVTFVSNTTEGLNLVAHSLQLRAGDRIVLASDEFPSVARIWETATRAGAELVPVQIDREQQRQASLLAALDERARVLVVSQTHSSTGTTLDLDVLAQHCAVHDTLLMVDGIQALGAVPTHLARVDVYASSFFKWMLSGFGIGILVTSPRVRDAIKPQFQGYANMHSARQLQYAHVNIPALYGLDATLDLFESLGWAAVHEQVRELGRSVFAVADRVGLDVVTPPDGHAGIFVVPVADPDAACQRLAERGISVCARGAGVRISPHFYNTVDEIDGCLRALAQIA